MSQEEFGEKYGIGTQTMVSQYLLGARPLNYDAAAKFARGLGCSIEDICPEMARTLSKDIFPVLRRRLRRSSAAALLAFITPMIAPQPADAAILHKSLSGPHVSVIRIAYLALLRWLRALMLVTFSAFALSACATRAPESVSVRWVRVPIAEIHNVCKGKHGDAAIVIGHYRGCSTWNRDAGVCTIWAPDFPEQRQRELMATLGHELKHCFDGPWH